MPSGLRQFPPAVLRRRGTCNLQTQLEIRQRRRRPGSKPKAGGRRVVLGRIEAIALSLLTLEPWGSRGFGLVFSWAVALKTRD